MENLNVVNDTQQPVVEAASQDLKAGTGFGDSLDEKVDTGVGSDTVMYEGTGKGDNLAQKRAKGFGDNNDAAQSQAQKQSFALDEGNLQDSKEQSPKENSKFKEFRVKEQKLLGELEQYQKVKEALGYGQTSLDEFAASVISAANGESVEQYKERIGAQQQAFEAEQKLKYYENLIIKHKMDSDLSEIQKLDSSVSSLSELGDKFCDLISLGWSAQDAYRAVKAAQNRPPQTGAVNVISDTESEFYSSSELDRLTPQQLDDPEVFKKALKSLKNLYH